MTEPQRYTADEAERTFLARQEDFKDLLWNHLDAEDLTSSYEAIKEFALAAQAGEPGADEAFSKWWGVHCSRVAILGAQTLLETLFDRAIDLLGEDHTPPGPPA